MLVAVGRLARCISCHLDSRLGPVEMTLPLVEESKGCADDLTGAPISAGSDLAVDESLKLGRERDVARLADGHGGGGVGR